MNTFYLNNKPEFPDTTEGCKKAIVEKYPDTEIGDWKRTFKTKNAHIVVRGFKNNKTGQEIVVSHDGFSPNVADKQQSKVPEHLKAIIGIIDGGEGAYDMNPSYFDEMDGNLIFFNGENEDEDSVRFYLGPANDGALHDSVFCDEWLKRTLDPWAKANSVRLSIGDSENTHSFEGKSGLLSSMLKTVRDALPNGVKLIEED